MALMLACLVAFSGSESAAQAPVEGRTQQASKSEFPSAEKLLHAASASLLRSSSFKCKVFFQNAMFGQVTTAEGYYLNKGQGSGKSKLHIAFGDQATRPIQITQVCNGRYNFCLTLGGEKPTFEFVDLLQIAQSDHREHVANPTAWMTTGGITSLLEHASRSLEFQPVREYSRADKSVWHLRGTWKKDALKRFFGPSVNHQWIENHKKWHKLPGQLPHVFEFHLARDPAFKLIPLQIDFLQLQEKDDSTEMKKVLSIQLQNFEMVAEMSEEHFKINDENVAPVDVTDLFMARVQQNYSNGTLSLIHI